MLWLTHCALWTWLGHAPCLALNFYNDCLYLLPVRCVIAHPKQGRLPGELYAWIPILLSNGGCRDSASLRSAFLLDTGRCIYSISLVWPKYAIVPFPSSMDPANQYGGFLFMEDTRECFSTRLLIVSWLQFTITAR